jgi:hypothetical protein
MSRDKYWRPPRPKSDEAKECERERRELQDQLAFLAEFGDEEDFKEAVKDHHPTPEQWEQWLTLFRPYPRQKRGLP